eukprot:2846242-Prymnesium_polylepis.1
MQPPPSPQYVQPAPAPQYVQPAPPPQTQILLVEQSAADAVPTQMGSAVAARSNNLDEAVEAEQLIAIGACCCTITSCYCAFPECLGCYSKGVLTCLDIECLACK